MKRINVTRGKPKIPEFTKERISELCPKHHFKENKLSYFAECKRALKFCRSGTKFNVHCHPSVPVSCSAYCGP
jgi:hypothetical protein